MNVGKTMYGYHEWAIQSMLGHLSGLPKDVLNNEVKSSYPSIAKTLSHILAVDTMWIHILERVEFQQALQDAMSQLPLTDAYTIEEFKSAFKNVATEYQSFLNENSDLTVTLDVNNSWSGSRETTFEEILLHVSNHGTYHLGNITTMLRQQNETSLMMDYSLFWYEDTTVTS
ncbi:DinB family protein [Exiguobacterium sp. s91]|uniref:DinB family protein n=1 Tax=Exiguobacterium sp. s91 TaxID=2751199 RepID=UPI001BEBF9D3|nr:DinB family protein [Exiguobacterium sp. s91]